MLINSLPSEETSDSQEENLINYSEFIPNPHVRAALDSDVMRTDDAENATDVLNTFLSWNRASV